MRFPLSVKVSTGVVAAVVLIVSILLVNAYYFLIAYETDELKRKLHVDLSRMQHTLEFLSQHNEHEQMQVELSSLAALPHVQLALLLDENSRVIAASQLAHLGKNAVDGVLTLQGQAVLKNKQASGNRLSSLVWEDADAQHLFAIYPLVLGLQDTDKLIDNRIGYIYARLDLSWVANKSLQILQLKAAPMLFLLLVMVAFFIILHDRFLVRRIKNINQAANAFAESGYQSRARVKGNDELADLAISFNQMADTVEQKNTELVNKEESISLILNTMENGVITIDESGRIHSFNCAAEKMLGYTEAEITGKNVSCIMPEPYRSEHDGYIQHFLQTGEKKIIGSARDVPAQHRDGHEFSIHLSVNELPYQVGGKRMFIGSCTDITLLKQQEMQLRHSQKMDALGKLTGGIAHDYNNMLGVILGYSELLLDQLPDDSKIKKYVNEIYHAGNRGANLTKKLLSFSRQKSAEPDVVDINSVLEQNRNMLEKTLTARIQLELHQQADLWPVFLDRNDLEDAILNMSINAMHAIEGSGKLEIQTRNFNIDRAQAAELKFPTGAGEYVRLRICDTGYGIDDESLGRIFDPFYSTKGDQGSGLGLSQVYGFVKRSSGLVRVESELARGTCFDLYFPRYLGELVQTASNTQTQATTARGKETILVVDDEPSLRFLLEETLSTVGYTVFMAENADQAIEVLKKEHIDLMISDVIMPGMDGYKLAEYVREHYPQVKIQLASGYSDNRHQQSRDPELHDALLVKPFDRQHLLYRVRELLHVNTTGGDA
jgi:PAS domain S-box-containing protein